jgi:hypothetical protein
MKKVSKYCSGPWSSLSTVPTTSVVDPQHFDADPDSTYHPDADPDSDFLFDVDPDKDTYPTFHPHEDPVPDPSFKKGLNP